MRDRRWSVYRTAPCAHRFCSRRLSFRCQTKVLHATAEHALATALLALRLTLHLLADLDVDLEELGYAAVEADGLALVEVGFAIRCVDAFRRARLEETVRARVSLDG